MAVRLSFLLIVYFRFSLGIIYLQPEYNCGREYGLKRITTAMMYVEINSPKIVQNRPWYFFTGAMSMRVKNRIENLQIHRQVGATAKYLQVVYELCFSSKE